MRDVNVFAYAINASVVFLSFSKYTWWKLEETVSECSEEMENGRQPAFRSDRRPSSSTEVRVRFMCLLYPTCHPKRIHRRVGGSRSRKSRAFIFRSENARQPADKIRAAHVKTCCVELCGCHMGLEQFLMEMNSLLWNALKNRRKLIDSKTVAKNNLFRLDSVRISQPHANQPFTTSLRTLMRKGRPYRLSKAIETSLCLCTGGTQQERTAE